MSTLDQVKVNHGLLFMTRFESMKERELICDFTIKVGNKSFPVHRAVLVASSDYFEGMFSSNMKEVQEGFVEMKNLGLNAIEQAIKFMYTGSAKITMESVQDILHVAELYQLDGLKNLCFQFMLGSLSPENCFSVINLAQTYNRQDVIEETERIIVTDFEAVISSKVFPFISRSDLLRYISNVSCETSWKAAITWAKDKEEFPQLIEGMDVKKFPFKFLPETVLEEPLVKKSERVRNLAISALFSDEKLWWNLNCNNCIRLGHLANQHNAEDAIKEGILSFIQSNFDEIYKSRDFSDISKDDVVAFFQSPKTKYFTETVKWEAALKWVKHDIQNRKTVFSELFSHINLEKLSLDFLSDIVRNESLVKESKLCTDMLVDALIKGRQTDYVLISCSSSSSVPFETAPRSATERSNIANFQTEGLFYPPAQGISGNTFGGYYSGNPQFQVSFDGVHLPLPANLNPFSQPQPFSQPERSTTPVQGRRRIKVGRKLKK